MGFVKSQTFFYILRVSSGFSWSGSLVSMGDLRFSKKSFNALYVPNRNLDLWIDLIFEHIVALLEILLK